MPRGRGPAELSPRTAPSGGSSSGGSAPRPAAPAPAVPSDVDSLNWAALAACESGGNPTIVSSNGLYHGLYQFSTRTWQSVGGSGAASQGVASSTALERK